MTAQTTRAPATAHAVRAAVDELRTAWPWLADTAIPGPAHLPLERYVNDDQAAAERREQGLDRAAAFAAVKAGTVGAAPHADAARTGAITARADALAQVRRLAERVHGGVHGTVWMPRYADPTLRQPVRDCWYCEATGRTYALPRPGHPPRPGSVFRVGPCPHCACQVCHATGRCYCDRADAVMAAALDQLDEDADAMPTDLLELTLRTVQQVDRRVRHAARTGEVAFVLKAACPACNRRDLVVNCTNPDPDRWWIRCRSPLCECAGDSCPCGGATRYEGRPHRWRAGDSWHTLARRLGVAPTDLLGEALRHRRRRIGSTQTGGGRSW